MPDREPMIDYVETREENIASKAAAQRYSLARSDFGGTPPVRRDKFIGFAKDEAAAVLLHESLAMHLPETNQIHVLDFRSALKILGGMTTPETVLVDLSGEDQPMNALMDLAEVVDAGTNVLAIGEIHNLNFYRTVTKGIGIKEYLAKPLTRALVERNFLPIIEHAADDDVGQRGGRMVALAGVRGGVGTSTIATNLAWFIGAELHRHTLLLDAELHTGTIGLNLDLHDNKGFGVALESPERLDHLLIERSMQQAGERLHVLAGQERLDKEVTYKAGSASPLAQTLRSRYNFVIADTGAKLSAFARDLQFIAQQRVIIMDPSMIAVRNLERLLTMQAGPSQSPRVMVVLNRAGTPGGLSETYMEQSLGLRFDAVIPDLPRVVPKTTQLGTPAAALRGPFRNAVGSLARALGATVLASAA